MNPIMHVARVYTRSIKQRIYLGGTHPHFPDLYGSLYVFACILFSLSDGLQETCECSRAPKEDKQ